VASTRDFLDPWKVQELERDLARAREMEEMLRQRVRQQQQQQRRRPAQGAQAGATAVDLLQGMEPFVNAPARRTRPGHTGPPPTPQPAAAAAAAATPESLRRRQQRERRPMTPQREPPAPPLN
jgi:hypothetical protein